MGINSRFIKNHSKTQALCCCQLLLLSSQRMLAHHGYKGRHQTPSSFSSLPFLASLPRILHCHQGKCTPSPCLSVLCPINYSVAQLEDSFIGYIIFLFSWQPPHTPCAYVPASECHHVPMDSGKLRTSLWPPCRGLKLVQLTSP